MNKLEREIRPPRYLAYIGRYFGRAVFWQLLLLTLLGVARIVISPLEARYQWNGTGMLSSSGASQSAAGIFIVALVALVAVVLVGYIRVSCTAIRIRQGRLQIEKGVFRKHVRNVDFWRVQSIDLDRRLVNRLTGDGTLVLSLTHGLVPNQFKKKRRWKDPALNVVEVRGAAHGAELFETYQDWLSLIFLLRGNPYS